MRILVLGGTGRIGRLILEQGIARGHAMTAQTRSPAPADPRDADALARLASGRDAVIMALGTDTGGLTTLFSDSTRAVLAAMDAAGVARLVAITGVGAGETRGHGGFLYDRVIFPLFTRHRYADKDRQEALLRDSRCDWTILRPAPFAATPGSEPLHALTEIGPATRLSRVTPAEVPRYALDCVEQGLHRRQAVFFGHGQA